MDDSWQRIILHADMDAFYAAVEELDDPRLRGRPLLVGPPGGRGVVLTANYAARPFGVGSAMPMAKARRLCPQAVVVPPRFERYVEMSRRIMAAFGEFTPLVEPLSLDEAFLDMSGAQGLFGAPEQMGRRVKAAVREATGGLAASVGVSGSKYVAKVASDVRKPDGLTVVPPSEARAFLAPLPVRRLWGAGPKTVARLEELGLHTVGAVAAADLVWLRSSLGLAGAHFHALARADDPRPVVPGRAAVSVGSERTLEHDVCDPATLRVYLRRSADEIARRLRRQRTTAEGVRVKLKTASFKSLSRQEHLSTPTDLAEELYAAASRLLDRFEHREPYRLVGMAAFALARDQPTQLGLFDPPARRRRQRLERTLDAVARRFGSGALRRAEDLEHPDGLRLADHLELADDS